MWPSQKAWTLKCRDTETKIVLQKIFEPIIFGANKLSIGHKGVINPVLKITFSTQLICSGNARVHALHIDAFWQYLSRWLFSIGRFSEDFIVLNFYKHVTVPVTFYICHKIIKLNPPKILDSILENMVSDLFIFERAYAMELAHVA